MPMIQTTWAAKPAPGQVGRRANMEEWNTLTRIAEVEGIGFAEPVQRGTGADQVVPFTTGKFLGLTECDYTIGTDAPGDPITFPVGWNTPVNEFGVLWANANGTCTQGGYVYWDAADKGYSDDDGGTLIPNAEFDSSAAAGDIVKIRLRRIPAAPPAAP